MSAEAGLGISSTISSGRDGPGVASTVRHGAPAATSRQLGQLRPGDVGRVAGVDATQLAAKRLADLGFIPGVEVEMIRPGRPCIVRLNGACLGLGTGLQQSVLLSPPLTADGS